MIELQTPPIIKSFSDISIKKPHTILLENGVELNVINHGDQEVFRIDVMLPGGVYNESSTFIASAVAAMLNKGTKNLDAMQIANELDFNGAWLQYNAGDHYSTISVYSINRCMHNVIAVLEQLIKYPTFPGDKLEVIKGRFCENLKNNMKVGKYLASRKFQQDYYGKDHPLGRPKTIESIQNISRESLIDFHKQYYIPQGTKIFLSGCVKDELISAVSDAFGKNWKSNSAPIVFEGANRNCTNEFAIVNRPESHQSSILLTADAPMRDNADFIPFRFLTILLGGFFGSRLMKNIREDKGYTYGIAAYLFGKKENSYLKIITECATDYTENVIEEIYNEVNKLIKVKVEDDELNTLKSYILSDLMCKSESPFSIADYYMSKEVVGLSDDYFDQQVEQAKNLDAEKLQKIAERYLSHIKFMIIIAGDENKLKKIKNQY